MIAYLSGRIIARLSTSIILSVNDVGYKVNVSPAFSGNDDNLELFVHEHIREDSDDLYGFLTLEELQLFELLISVNGIGPKVAMSIMTSGKTEEITGAIISENMAFFKAISGIGSKAAARVILDLKSKVGHEKIGGTFIKKASEGEDIADALTALGYKKHEAEKIISKIPVELKLLEEKVRWCLKNISK